MTSWQIQYFLSAARHLNFTAAAEEFFISQPTISRQIRLLEEELGFPLFLRDHQNVRLTPGGLVMLREFSRAVDIVSEGRDQALRVSRGLEGEIAIGCREGMRTDYFVGPPTTQFSKTYPNVGVSMCERSYAELRRMLYGGELDVIFTFDFELPYMQGVLSQVCYPVTSVIAMSRHHPLAERLDAAPADFSGETFLLPAPADSAGREEELRRIMAGLGCVDIRVEFVPNLRTLYMGIRAQKGVALLDTSTECIYDEHFRYIELPREMSPLSIVAVWLRDDLNPVIPLYLETMSRAGEIDVFHN